MRCLRLTVPLLCSLTVAPSLAGAAATKGDLALVSRFIHGTTERRLVEREGLCIGCHQLYGRPEWDALRERVGPARTTRNTRRGCGRRFKP